MAPDRPLNYNSTISPELIASTVAEADRRGRFWVRVDAGADRSPGEWDRYEGLGGPWTDGDVAATAFDPVFRIILAAVTACRLSGLTSKVLSGEPDAPREWLARYATRNRRAFDVDVTAEGVGDDLGAWWWLVKHAQPVVSCDATRLDVATLFTTVTGITFMTTRYLSSAAVSHAKACAANAGTVALLPMPHHTGWQMVIAAAPGLAGALGREAVVRCQLPERVLRASEKMDATILATMEASTFWSSGIHGDNFEKMLGTTLRRGEKYPTTPRDAIRALAAAEGVAIAEGRALDTMAEGMAELVTSWILRAAEAADPVSDATIELASRAVAAIAEAGVSERTRFESDEGRALYRAELDGLRKRLQAAQAARRVRASAPNAVPLPALRGIHGRPINWRTKWVHLLLDDAIAFIAAVRDDTGATPLILMKDLTFHELTTDWDAREMVSRIRGCAFEERDGDWPGVGWPELKLGQRVLFWWPDVSPRPVASGTEESWEITSWGHAELLLRGATPGRVIRSEWRYPTGMELKQDKFAGPGPWQDVDWKLLRRKVKEVGTLVTGTLGGVVPIGLRDFWTLPAAAASARAGARVLMGDYFSSAATLPP